MAGTTRENRTWAEGKSTLEKHNLFKSGKVKLRTLKSGVVSECKFYRLPHVWSPPTLLRSSHLRVTLFPLADKSPPLPSLSSSYDSWRLFTIRELYINLRMALFVDRFEMIGYRLCCQLISKSSLSNSLLLFHFHLWSPNCPPNLLFSYSFTCRRQHSNSFSLAVCFFMRASECNHTLTHFRLRSSFTKMKWR